MRILKRTISILVILCMLLSLTACFDSKKSSSSAVGDGGGDFVSKKKKTEVVVEGELEIHFLELGNKYTGDCTYIKAGENDILIDAGSKVSSIETIDKYVSQYVTDDILEYVIVTHAHEDHYAGFATDEKKDSIFDLYECKTIIDFAQIIINDAVVNANTQKCKSRKHAKNDSHGFENLLLFGLFFFRGGRFNCGFCFFFLHKN